ncbi:Uncharacterised protein [Cronobacter sakazakii]|nr:Uncharacterised protein [Cronobacter sakazakii]
MSSRPRHVKLNEYPLDVSVEFVDVGHLVTSLHETPAPWGQIHLSDIPGEDAGRYFDAQNAGQPGRRDAG